MHLTNPTGADFRASKLSFTKMVYSKTALTNHFNIKKHFIKKTIFRLGFNNSVVLKFGVWAFYEIN